MYELETHYLDVGQGDCSLIVVRETKSYKIVRVVVYDCGSSRGGFAAKKLLQKCHSIGITEIHVAIISHFDKDHFNGFTSLFHMGASATSKNYLQARRLFRNTIVYSQGCIFKLYEEPDINDGDEFLSAYYFTKKTLSSKTSILRDYTGLLSAMSKFRASLNDSSRFTHFSERHLAGFPTSNWNRKTYPPGPYSVFNWDPTDKKPNEVLNNDFSFVEFESGNTLLGEDLMNLGFDDVLHESVRLICIAVNKDTYKKSSLSKTDKPKKEGNVANNMSLSCLLIYDNYSAFFGGDLETTIEDRLIAPINYLTDNLGLTILKAGHHGSDKSTSTNFLNKLTPKLVVITCGDQNAHNHPAIKLIERLNKSKVVQRVIIAGFGVRQRTLEDEKKRPASKRKTQKQLDADFSKRIGAYERNNVPVNSTDIYDPNGKFVLAGTFSRDEDGSIEIGCFIDTDHQISAEPVFQHVFTQMALIVDGDEQLQSPKRSVKMLSETTKNRKRKRQISEEDDKYIMEEFNEDGSPTGRTLRVRIVGGITVAEVIKKRRFQLNQKPNHETV
jgi:beta-lactamase superfamily II metal-dependent hydrolase